MEHAGEGHFSMYFEQDKTGIGALISQIAGGQGQALASVCPSISNAFKPYERNTSSPSDPSSIVLGIFHSSISGGFISSTVRRTSADGFSLTMIGTDEWDMCTSMIQRQTDPKNPMVFQMAIFMEIIRITSELMDRAPRFSQLEPIAIHLEVDLFTYRTMIMFAEKSRLRFRFFPTLAHWQLDKHREQCERAGQEIEEVDSNAPGHTIEVALKDLPAERAPDSMRYHVIAYCAACGDKLAPEKRRQCSQCRLAFYCNAECQKKDWQNLHKKECKKFSKLMAEADCEYFKTK